MKRLISVFLALLMLCGLLPGLAEEGCSHRWGEWQLRDMNCQTGGKFVRTCKECGAAQEKSVGPGHDMSPWYRNGIPTCTKNGSERRDCKRCDYYETRPMPMVDHAFGEWTSVAEPGSDGAEVMERVCAVCGFAERQETAAEAAPDRPVTAVTLRCISALPDAILQEETASIDFMAVNTGETPVRLTDFEVHAALGDGWFETLEELRATPGVPAEECILQPGESRVFTLAVTPLGADMDRGRVIRTVRMTATALTDGEGDLVSPDEVLLSAEIAFAVYAAQGSAQEGGVVLLQRILSRPANGERYALGEEIAFETLVYNEGETEVIVIAAVNCTEDVPLTEGRVRLMPGDVLQLSSPHAITQSDAASGLVTSEIGVFWISVPEGGVQYSWKRNIAYTEPLPAAPGELSVSKRALTSPSHGGAFWAGEEIDYEITVTNRTGAPLTDVTVTDPLAGSGEAGVVLRIPELPDGGSRTATFTHLITEKDEADGFVSSAAAVSARKPDGAEITAQSLPVTQRAARLDGMILSIEVISTPENGQYYVPGEAVRYAITLENDGRTPFYVAELTDDLLTGDYRSETADGRKCLFAADRFAGGRTETVVATYVVTEDDAEAGEVWNTSVLNCVGYEGTALVARTRMAVSCGVPAPVTPAVIVSVKLVSEPANGEYYTPGEKLLYNITVTNNTDAPLEQVTVFDLYSGDSAIGYIAELGVHGSISCLRPVTVTQEHAQLGRAENQVTVNVQDAKGAHTEKGEVVSAPAGENAQ